MSKIGKAFMSLILDKKARDALQNAAQRPQPDPLQTPPVSAPQRPEPSPEPSQAQIKAQLDAKLNGMQNHLPQTASPTRQQLIQDARRVHAARQDVLDDLSAEQKMKLQVMAMKAMGPKRAR